MRDQTLPLSHFEQIYTRGTDPWHYATSAYEAAKYAASIEALPRERYENAFEVGCSVGVLTALLAERCDALLAVEPVETALAAARGRNAGKGWLRFEPMFVPAAWPDESFDLIVLSEVLDYLGKADLVRLGNRLRSTLCAGGDVLLVHWIGKKGGREAQPTESTEILMDAAQDFLRPVRQARNAVYRLDCLRRFN
jgi:SAM-dependent methyltransferase